MVRSITISCCIIVVIELSIVRFESLSKFLLFSGIDMKSGINWRNFGLVLLIWLVITAFGIVETVRGSQFRNAGFETIDDAKVTDYLVITSSCSSGSSACYNAYAVASYGTGFSQSCNVINKKGIENGTQALVDTQEAFPLNTVLTVFRDKGTENCRTQERSDTGAIIGVILLALSGLVLLTLPITWRWMFDVVLSEDGGVGKVQAVELLSLTPKEAAALKKGQSISMARKASMRISKEKNKDLSEKFSKHLVEMQQQENDSARSKSGVDDGSDWASISPSKPTRHEV